MRRAIPLFFLLWFILPTWGQTPHVPTAAALPSANADPTYPSTITTIKTVCASGCDYAETGNGNGLAQAISDAISNRDAWTIGNDAIEIRVDDALTITRSSPYALSGCLATTEIIIRTDATSLPSRGTRVSSANWSNMPTLRQNVNNGKIFTVAPSSCGFRLFGLYVTTTATGGTLVEVGANNSAQDTSAEVPADIWIDRSRIGCDAGDGTQACSWGTQFQAKDSGIVDSHFEGFRDHSEAKCFGWWNTPGPILVENNYCQAEGISFMSGGAALPNTGEQYNPSDITIRRSYFTANPAWQDDAPADYVAKNRGELKTGGRVLIEGNVFENSWVEGQNGQCWNFKSSNSGNGNTWAATQDVTVRYNICRNAEGEGFSIQGWNGIFGSTITQRITIHDNLFDGVSNGIQVMGFLGSPIGSGTCSIAGCPSSATDQITKNIFIYNNTYVASTRFNASLKGAYAGLDVNVPAGNPRCSFNAAMHNNIFPLTREGAIATSSSNYQICKINGVRNDSLFWSHDYDSLHANYLTNANSAGCTTPNLTSKALAQNAAGCSSDQSSAFATFSVANIGTGSNDYTQAGGVPNGVNLGSGVRKVGADIATLTDKTCGAISGNWSCAASAQTYTSIQKGYTVGAASAASHACTLSSTVTVGNVVTVPVIWVNQGRGIGNVSDTLGNTWQIDNAATTVGAVSIGFVSAKITNGGSSTTITVGVTGGNSGGGTLFCQEWSASTGWPTVYFDVAGGAANGTASTAVDSAAITTTQDGDLVLCPLSLGNPRTIAWDTGWTAEHPSPDSGSSAKLASGMAQTAGSKACGGDLGSTTDWRLKVAAYKSNAP